MGAGVAKEIRTRFPEVYEKDSELHHTGYNILGSCHCVKLKDPAASIKYVANLYGQRDIGAGSRQLDYEAFYCALYKLRVWMHSDGFYTSLAMPYKIGCGLAGGSWDIVEPIIREVFNQTDITINLYKL